MKTRLSGLILFLLLAVSVVPAQFRAYDGQAMRRGLYAFERDLVEQKVASKLMGREMPYRIILPTTYKQSTNERYPVVYLLHGLMGHFNNWTDKTRIGLGSNARNFIIVTPEGEDGWYTDSASKASDKYESYIIQELIPEIDKKFRTLPDRQHRAIAGLSMGGFGALKFGLKYPELFSFAGSFSGAIGAATITEKEFPGAIGKTIASIFGPVGSSTRSANDPFAIIRTASPEKIKTFPYIYLDCGTEDFLFQNNREFVALLLEKKVPHEFRELPGAHDWTYWGAQVEEFLELAEKRFTPKD
jgi:S-formylglutathione hydrolase FrmB